MWVPLGSGVDQELRTLLAALPAGSPAREAVAGAIKSDAERKVAAEDREASAGMGGVPLRGAMDPFTEEIFFVEAPYEWTVRDHAAWLPQGARSEHQGSLKTLLALLQPPATPSRKLLLTEAGPSWTAVFTQAGRGEDWISHFAARLRTRVVRTVYSPHIVKGRDVVRYGNTRMTVSDGRRTPSGERTIQAVRHDAGWEWEEFGAVLPFENTKHYEHKRIAARFDIDILTEYCHALGIFRDDEGFYGPRGTLVET